MCGIVGTLNLMRSPTGRAFIAIRDSETAARSMGVNVALYKVKSFAISAAITGLAGVLFAHKMTFISPEMFTLQLSIDTRLQRAAKNALIYGMDQARLNGHSPTGASGSPTTS